MDNTSDRFIPAKIYERITKLCEEGNELLDTENYDEAYHRFMAALNLIPHPQLEHEAAGWILGTLGDLYFSTADYRQTVNAIGQAMHCPGALGNPFLHLRLGEAQFELGDLDRAADELCRAYVGAGAEIFKDEDSKYFAFLKTRIQPRVGEEW